VYVHAGATRVLDEPVCGAALASNWLRVAGESQTHLLPPGP
jgi:hypothetical protein